jgi:NitT/TauT family transport system permease protein
VSAGTTAPLSRWTRRLDEWLPSAAVFALVIAAWEGLSRLLNVQSFLLPRPSLIVDQLVELWPTTLARGVTFTASEALGGLLAGVVTGTIAGLATARWQSARETLLPVGIAASTVPIIAFAPITINWFGPESALPRVIIVAAMVFFPVMVNTIRGLTQVDPAALELMASYAASETATLRKVRIPNALPYWFTALRIATTLSVIGAVVGEFFGGPLYSLGIYITNQTSISDYPKAWAAIVLACALGIGFYALAVVAERVVLPWNAARETAR